MGRARPCTPSCARHPILRPSPRPAPAPRPAPVTRSCPCLGWHSHLRLCGFVTRQEESASGGRRGGSCVQAAAVKAPLLGGWGFWGAGEFGVPGAGG